MRIADPAHGAPIVEAIFVDCSGVCTLLRTEWRIDLKEQDLQMSVRAGQRTCGCQRILKDRLAKIASDCGLPSAAIPGRGRVPTKFKRRASTRKGGQTCRTSLSVVGVRTSSATWTIHGPGAMGKECSGS